MVCGSPSKGDLTLKLNLLFYPLQVHWQAGALAPGTRGAPGRVEADSGGPDHNAPSRRRQRGPGQQCCDLRPPPVEAATASAHIQVTLLTAQPPFPWRDLFSPTCWSIASIVLSPFNSISEGHTLGAKITVFFSIFSLCSLFLPL